MAYLFTDLDNTLIFSHRHETKGKKVWVESLNEKNQSFMTYKAYRFFAEQKIAEVIPVTTRSFAQYDRLAELAEQLKWEKALVCNGAVLIINNREDKEWFAESRKISKQDIPMLKKLYSIALENAGEEAVVNICDLMFYVKSNDSDKIFFALSEAADTHINVLRDSRKIYCIPASLNKGKAIERYISRFGKQFSISAGDSLFDVPMFEKTDICLYPQQLTVKNISGISCSGIFSDTICSQLETIYKEGVPGG